MMSQVTSAIIQCANRIGADWRSLNVPVSKNYLTVFGSPRDLSLIGSSNSDIVYDRRRTDSSCIVCHAKAS